MKKKKTRKDTLQVILKFLLDWQKARHEHKTTITLNRQKAKKEKKEEKGNLELILNFMEKVITKWFLHRENMRLIKKESKKDKYDFKKENKLESKKKKKDWKKFINMKSVIGLLSILFILFGSDKHFKSKAEHVFGSENFGLITTAEPLQFKRCLTDNGIETDIQIDFITDEECQDDSFEKVIRKTKFVISKQVIAMIDLTT